MAAVRDSLASKVVPGVELVYQHCVVSSVRAVAVVLRLAVATRIVISVSSLAKVSFIEDFQSK